MIVIPVPFLHIGNTVLEEYLGYLAQSLTCWVTLNKSLNSPWFLFCYLQVWSGGSKDMFQEFTLLYI